MPQPNTKQTHSGFFISLCITVFQDISTSSEARGGSLCCSSRKCSRHRGPLTACFTQKESTIWTACVESKEQE